MRRFNLVITAIIVLLGVSNLQAQDDKGNSLSKFYVKPYGGFIGIQDMDIQFVNTNTIEDLKIESGFGYTAGISLGYDISKNFTTEIGWEYKSNKITITNGDESSKGDYASNFIYLNGIYKFSSTTNFKPYLGLGISYIQEIDLDFGTGENTSFSKSGDIGFQGIIGLDYNFTTKWALNWEAKIVTFSKLDLDNEANTNKLTTLKYNPFIFNIGIKHLF